jgi:hypothetical protein
MTWISRAFFASVLLLLFFSSSFPQETLNRYQQPAETETTLVQAVSGRTREDLITIKSGGIQITTPTGWKSVSDLNDSADLQASDARNRLYLIILSDKKIDFAEMTLARHAKQTLAEIMVSLTSVTQNGPSTLKVNGNPTLQYEVRGTIENLNVVYFHTTVESSAHFHQIVAWMPISKYESHKGVMQEIIRSFKEL